MMDSKFALAHIKVEVYNSSSRYYERFPPSTPHKTFLVSLVTDLLKALSDPTQKFHHLLAPLLSLLPQAPLELSSYTSPESYREYISENVAKLCRIAYEIRERFSHTPLVFLIVDDQDVRWAETFPALGMENTVIIEKQLMDVLALQTPEARLFSFLVVYHEIGHLFKQWHNDHCHNVEFRHKTNIPLDDLMEIHSSVWGDAGEFVEWASMGGVSHWVDKGLFLHVAPQQIRRITSEQAQRWWDSGFYPHITRFIDDSEVQNGLGSRIAQPSTSTPTQTKIAVSSLDPDSPDRDKTNNSNDPAPFRTWESIICSNMQSMQRLGDENENTWIARVCEKSAGEYSLAVPTEKYY